MSTAKNRRPITIQADPIRDSDLLDWLDAVPEGKRQRYLKDALRRGIAAEKRDRDALQSVDDLRYGVSVIHNDLAGLASFVRQLSTRPAGINSDELQKAVTQALIGLSGATGIPIPNEEPTVESAPRLSDEEIQQKENAIRAKAKWKR